MKREMEDIIIKEFEADLSNLGAIKKLKAYKANYDFEVQNLEEDKAKLREAKEVGQAQSKDTFSFQDDALKNRMIQKSFWVGDADQTRMLALKCYEDQKQHDRPSSKMICPADKKHKISTKTLFPLTFKSGFDCFSCRNKLGFQKIVALKTCSHVHCKDCLKDFCGKTMTCTCGKPFLAGDVVKIDEAKSAFATHNQVEASTYNPAFGA